MASTVLELRDLSLELDGNRILNKINLEVWGGHIHAIVGPNGAGKSTLAYTLMGLEGYRHHEGDIVFKGESLNGLDIEQRARKGITLAWQEPARFEGLLVRDFIRAGARDGSDGNLRSVLNNVGMHESYLERAVDNTLSGGERKKIELASIIAMEPELVLLDEPDSGIDVDSLKRIFDAIRLFKSRGATVIMITHSPTVLGQAEHAFLMCHGELIKKGESENIFPYFRSECVPCEHPNEPEVREIGDGT